MAAHLEHRRQAIAEALRAVMTEPLPTAPDPEPVAAPVPAPVTVVPAAAAKALDLPSLRDSLTAQIDWDEIEAVEPEDYVVWSPPIPPLEIAGAMSSTASMALFGHA